MTQEPYLAVSLKGISRFIPNTLGHSLLSSSKSNMGPNNYTLLFPTMTKHLLFKSQTKFERLRPFLRRL